MPAVALLACAAVAHGHWEKGMGLRDAHRHGPGARIRYLRETTKKEKRRRLEQREQVAFKAHAPHHDSPQPPSCTQTGR